MKKIEIPKLPIHSDVTVNNEFVRDEIRLTIDVFGAKVEINGADLNHLRYVKKLLNELVK